MEPQHTGCEQRQDVKGNKMFFTLCERPSFTLIHNSKQNYSSANFQLYKE